MRPVPSVTWDWFYDDNSRRSTHMIVKSEHPDYPVLAKWRGGPAHELIQRAQQLISDLNEGRTTFKRVYEENAS